MGLGPKEGRVKSESEVASGLHLHHDSGKSLLEMKILYKSPECHKSETFRGSIHVRAHARVYVCMYTLTCMTL